MAPHTLLDIAPVAPEPPQGANSIALSEQSIEWQTCTTGPSVTESGLWAPKQFSFGTRDIVQRVRHLHATNFGYHSETGLMVEDFEHFGMVGVQQLCESIINIDTSITTLSKQ